VRAFPSSVETERLRGDRPERRDAAALVPIIGDPAIPEEVFPAALRTSGRTLAFLDAAIRHWDEHGFGLWVARERDGGRTVGRVGLMATDVGAGPTVEVGWFIARDRWGRGYATELARAAIHHAFTGLRLPEVVSFTLPGNQASQAVMRKLGLEPAGRIERLAMPHVLLRLSRDAWERQAAGGAAPDLAG
jgi:RimJ/RimL family protein N-acetyltransferase